MTKNHVTSFRIVKKKQKTRDGFEPPGCKTTPERVLWNALWAVSDIDSSYLSSTSPRTLFRSAVILYLGILQMSQWAAVAERAGGRRVTSALTRESLNKNNGIVREDLSITR